MAQLLVREIPDRIVVELKKRAKRNGRSAEAEHRAILQEALVPAGRDFWEQAVKLRDATKGRIHTDSAELIRAERDKRARH